MWGGSRVLLYRPLVVACSLSLLSFCRRDAPVSKQTLSSAYAAQTSRPLMARLSGFPYAPAPRLVRGEAASVDAALKSIAYRILASSDPAGEKSYAAALIVGKQSEAEASLQAQLKREPRRADLWNDLAATL